MPWLWGAMKQDGILIINPVYCIIASNITLGHAVYLSVRLGARTLSVKALPYASDRGDLKHH